MEDVTEWKSMSGLSKPTYEQLEAFCAQLADENARLRKEVSLAGGCAAIEYNGMKVIVSPDTPPILIDESGVRFMGLGYAKDNGEV